MTWKEWVEQIESQGVDDSTEMSFIMVEGGYLPEVTVHRPDPDDASYKVADVTQGDHENDVGFSAAEADEFPTEEMPVVSIDTS